MYPLNNQNELALEFGFLCEDLSKHLIYDSLCSDDTARDALRLVSAKELGETKV